MQRFSTNLFAEETTDDDLSKMLPRGRILEQTREERIICSMLNAGTLTFEEFAMREPLSLATTHDAMLDFLRGRDDAVVFGAQAVNAYVGEARMSQDIDLISTRAVELAEELREHLSEHFHISVQESVIGAGKGYRLFQIHKPRNRHLVDLRPAESLPRAERIEDCPGDVPAGTDRAKGDLVSSEAWSTEGRDRLARSSDAAVDVS